MLYAYTLQVMYMGVVANPIPEHNFTGKIFLERVSRVEKYKRATSNQNFTDDATANGMIKDGDWKELVQEDDIKLHELRDMIADQYGIDDDIKEKLVIHYKSPNGKTTKWTEDECDLRNTCNWTTTLSW